jgi:UDP-N-acetylglucosamine--N-acetylmuramyl-(pentapeptide) pyrophosphoryl-undecaprenol N-acetylglucosamine transferase
MIRIVLAGGGTGGHIYPLLAVADEIRRLTDNAAEIFYIGPKNAFGREFDKREVRQIFIFSSKLRRYVDFQNFLDIPKFFLSVFQALFHLYVLMPDVVFSKGGPGALAVILAAKFYMIPIVIHESDAIPGLTNRLSAYFANRIGIAFRGAADYFPAKKLAFVGNPVRLNLLEGWLEQGEAKVQLGFKPNEPLLLFLGGSQGAQRLNNFIFDSLEILLREYQVYHQVGEANLEEAKFFFAAFEKGKPEEFKGKYRFVGYLDDAALKLAMNAADIVISRAGAGAIYEIAAFRKPSILIPLDGSANDHQRQNAYEYAKVGAAIVVEEENLKVNILIVQIKNILGDSNNLKYMSESAAQFFKPAAAEKIAEEILRLGKWSAQK